MEKSLFQLIKMFEPTYRKPRAIYIIQSPVMNKLALLVIKNWLSSWWLYKLYVLLMHWNYIFLSYPILSHTTKKSKQN